MHNLVWRGCVALLFFFFFFKKQAGGKLSSCELGSCFAECFKAQSSFQDTSQRVCDYWGCLSRVLAATGCVGWGAVGPGLAVPAACLLSANSCDAGISTLLAHGTARLLFSNSAHSSRNRKCSTVSFYLLHCVATCYIFKRPGVCKQWRGNTESFSWRKIQFLFVYLFWWWLFMKFYNKHLYIYLFLQSLQK